VRSHGRLFLEGSDREEDSSSHSESSGQSTPRERNRSGTGEQRFLRAQATISNSLPSLAISPRMFSQSPPQSNRESHSPEPIRKSKSKNFLDRFRASPSKERELLDESQSQLIFLADISKRIRKLTEEEERIQKRVDALYEKEKELLRSCSVLEETCSGKSKSKTRTRISGNSKKIPKIVVDTGNIVICDRIGSGCSGAVVYSCLVDGWQCAMKQLASENKADTENFEKEMNILYNLPSHPNIVRYLFHRRIRGRICLFMTRYDSTLQSIIRKRRESQSYFTFSQICFIGSQILEGIAFLHKHQIIHRDIKTENIYVSTSHEGTMKEVVIADFDSAKRIGVGTTLQSTIGTFGYMAPEVYKRNVKDSLGYTNNADVFSFGMVLYSLISLEEPYSHISNPFNIYQAIQNGENPLLSEEQKVRYHSGIFLLYQACTHADPDQRPLVSVIGTQLAALASLAT